MDVKRKSCKRTANKPTCQYGSKCYRKNPEHLDKYLHPDHDNSKKKLPDIDRCTKGTKQSLQNELKAADNPKEALSKLLDDWREGLREPEDPQKSEILAKLVDEYREDLKKKEDLKKQEELKKQEDLKKQEELKKQEDLKKLASPNVGQHRPFPQPSSSVPNNAKQQPLQKIVQPETDAGPRFLGDTLNKRSGETVQEVLKLMPSDFFDFWNFCATINEAKPEDAFAEIGFHLVGVYDLLSKQLPKTKTVYLHCHWRYYYDPPEFQTIIKLDGKDLFHIGYFRDDPSEFPAILASNNANLGAKLTLMGDNVFAAMNSALTKVLKRMKKFDKRMLKRKFLNIQHDLQELAEKKKYSLQTETENTKARQEKVVAKTFHSLGIVVPVRKGIGYRTLSITDASLKKVLYEIVTAQDEKKKEGNENILFAVITNVNYANDECDFGTGLELGIDLFCFGDPCFDKDILFLLPLAYHLLKRYRYGEIVHAHLKNRKTGGDLADLQF